MLHTDILFSPTLSSLIKSRSTCLAISGAAALHLALVSLGLPGWQCPLRYGAGIPCPGCGLSRATVALFQGHWKTAIEIHAFAPLLILVISLIVVASLLPKAPRLSFISSLETVEVNSGITNVLLLVFLFYWLARLLFFSEFFYGLVM